MATVSSGLERRQQQPEGIAQKRQLVRRVHRPGRVDEEDKIGTRRLRCRRHIALDADPHQLRLGIPWRGHDGDIRLERRVQAVGCRVVVREVVDELLHANRVRGRQYTLVEPRPHEGVGRGVDVDGEGRDRLFGDDLDRVRVERLEAVAALIAVDLCWSLRIRGERRETLEMRASVGRNCRRREACPGAICGTVGAGNGRCANCATRRSWRFRLGRAPRK